jgi:hypothetical protein
MGSNTEISLTHDEGASVHAEHDLDEAPRFAYHDRVSVPDGRIGEVIGFYRRIHESVLVRFPSGESDEFLAVAVEPRP